MEPKPYTPDRKGPAVPRRRRRRHPAAGARRATLMASLAAASGLTGFIAAHGAATAASTSTRSVSSSATRTVTRSRAPVLVNNFGSATAASGSSSGNAVTSTHGS
jgi:hypothetical protein